MDEGERERERELTDVLLLELSGDVALDEGGLTDTSISDEDKLELSGFRHFFLKKKSLKREKDDFSTTNCL